MNKITAQTETVAPFNEHYIRTELVCYGGKVVLVVLHKSDSKNLFPLPYHRYQKCIEAGRILTEAEYEALLQKEIHLVNVHNRLVNLDLLCLERKFSPSQSAEFCAVIDAEIAKIEGSAG